MTVVAPRPHSSVAVLDRPTVILHMASGANRAFTGVTCIYGGYAGGTLTVRHDSGVETFKVKDSPNEYVPRNSVSCKSDKVKRMSVLDRDARRFATHDLYGALTDTLTGSEDPREG